MSTEKLNGKTETQNPVGSSELLACPFCGGSAEVHDHGSSDIGEWWMAGCKECGIWMPNENEGATREAAVAAWNTRNQANDKLSEGADK